ncbi:hypothetical protein B1R94_08555 [Mycolicibacterium litorale]|nr:hypothetical protein B1R94_08555 [Mycolicibacterium litorale]
MRFRAPLVGLSLFMVVALAVTWLVYVSLRRDVAGGTAGYSAVFTDVYGLREGDDVRMAGVRVGRVEKISLDGTLAKVSFVVQDDQVLYGNTVASVTYQNIVGQRYLGLSLGTEGSVDRLAPGSVIGLDRTEPSFDVTALLNGYEPLFSLLSPRDADNLTKALIQSLQGDTTSLATLISQTTALTETFAGKDQALGAVITNLNTVVTSLARQNANLDGIISSTRDTVATLDQRRPALVAATGSVARLADRLSASATDVYPSLTEMIQRQPGAVQHLLSVEPQVAFFADNIPLVLKGITRMGNQGAYGNGYACDANLLGFFPGLNDVVPIIVNAATPGGKAQHTPNAGTPAMADLRVWRAMRGRPLESYHTTWLGLIAVAVVAVVIGALVVVHTVGIGLRHYTAEFLQAAALRVGNPITIAGIPVGTVSSMRLAGDHVEAGLKIREDIALGEDSRAVIKVATILGSRYLALEPGGSATLPNRTFDLAHTEVPYDLQAALKDATTTFEQVDSDRFAQSLSLLGKQLRDMPAVVPQAMANIDALSSIIAARRDQIGQLLASTEEVTNTLRSQQANLGALVNQGQDLLGQFVARRAVFHAMMQSLTNLVDILNKLVVNDRPQVDALVRDTRELTGLIAQHDDLFRNILQVSPVMLRQIANMTGDGNAVNFTAPAGALVDSWMCAISGRAQQFGMIPYYKDCQ